MSHWSESYQGDINDLLLKKVQLCPFTNTSNSIAFEGQGSASYKIQSKNIYSQDIPTTVSDIGELQLYGSGGEYSGGSKYIPVNTDYSHIVKYEDIGLTKLPGDKGYYYGGTDPNNIVGTNILSDAIPPNQDPAGSYSITIKRTDTGEKLSQDIKFYFDVASGYIYFFVAPNFNPIITFWRYEGGKGISSVVGDLSVSGQVNAVSFNATSDIRLKKEIKPLENSLEKICSLQGVEFEFINDLMKRKNLGFIAQDIEQIIPEVVSTNEKGDQYKSVAYGNIVALLVEAIKELREEVKQLKNK